MESNIEIEIPKEIWDMVKRHENCIKHNIEEARTIDTGTLGEGKVFSQLSI